MRGKRKNLSVIVMVALLLNFTCSSLIAAPQNSKPKQTKEEKRVARLKELIGQLGTGRDARVGVKLTDGTTVEGYVTETSGDQFVVTNDKTAAVTTIPYAQVKKVNLLPTVKTMIKKQSTPSSIFKKVAIGTLAVVGVALVMCLASKGHCMD
jgi:hypothetical protein